MFNEAAVILLNKLGNVHMGKNVSAHLGKNAFESFTDTFD